MSSVFSKLTSKFCSLPVMRLSRSLTSSSTVIERTRIKSNDLDPATFYQLDIAYCRTPIKFSVSSMLEMKESGDKNKSLATLRGELLVREGFN